MLFFFRNAGAWPPRFFFVRARSAEDRSPRASTCPRSVVRERPLPNGVTVARPPPFTVGRGPVPRRASIGKTALVCVRFSRRSNDRGGQAPALRYARPSPFHRRARACPSPCLDWGNGLGLRAFFAQVERSRGTGPRATGQEGSLRHTPFGSRRSRTTIFCSYNLANLVNLVNPAPILLQHLTCNTLHFLIN